MSDDDSAKLVLGPLSMQHDAQTNHDPRQPRGGKGEQAQEAEHCIGMTSAPDIDQGAAKGGAEESLRE